LLDSISTFKAVDGQILLVVLANSWSRSGRRVTPLESLHRPSYKRNVRDVHPPEWIFEKEEWDENQKPESGTHVWFRQLAIE